MQAKYEVADVLRQVNIRDAAFCIQQEKTLRAVMQCRTAALGGHVDACVMSAAQCALATIVVATGTVLNARDINARRGYKSVKLTCCPAHTIM